MDSKCPNSEDGKHHYGSLSDLCLHCGRDILNDSLMGRFIIKFMNNIPIILVILIVVFLFIWGEQYV